MGCVAAVLDVIEMVARDGEIDRQDGGEGGIGVCEILFTTACFRLRKSRSKLRSKDSTTRRLPKDNHDVSLKKTSHNPPPSHLHHNNPAASLPHHLPYSRSHSPLPISSIPPRPPSLSEMPPSIPPTILRDIRNADQKNPQIHSTGRLALWWMSGA